MTHLRHSKNGLPTRMRYNSATAFRPVPDFCLVVHAAHMPDYLAMVQRLLTSDANVRNVKAYFSIKRSKFGARLPLGA